MAKHLLLSRIFKIPLSFILAGFIAATAGIYFRLYPLFAHSSFGAYEKASVLVISRLKKSIANRIEKSTSNFPAFEKNKIIQESFNHLLQKENKMVRYSIDKLSREMDSQIHQGFSPYLLEADPYNYYSLTQNILRTGNLSDTIKGSKYLNRLMLAPDGNWEPFTLHPFVGYLTFRFLSFFSPAMTLMQAVSFVPVILGALVLVPFLFLAYRLGCGFAAAMSGSLLLVLSPIFLRRSAYGWYDNDPYNILFPLLILLLYFLGLEKLPRRRENLFYGFLCSACIGLYALFWHGWVYLPLLILFSGIAVILYNFLALKNKVPLINLVLYFGVILFGSFLTVSLFFGFNDFFVLFAEGGKALKNFLTPQLTLWPDIYINVGELKKATLAEIIELDGGIIFFGIAVCGLIEIVRRLWKRKDAPELFFIITIICFFAFLFFIAMGAQRFSLLTVIPMSLLSLFGIEALLRIGKKLFEAKCSRIKYKKFAFLAFQWIFLVMLLTPSTFFAHQAIMSWRPIYNDTWDRAFQKIRRETPPESIINSWWPPGHFIKAMGERRVIFDGATINKPQAYWMAYILLSEDEPRALGLLRMLNDGGNNATQYLLDCGLPLSLAIQKLKEISTFTPFEAQTALKNLLNQRQIDELLKFTHQSPPAAYVFLYNDLIEKNLELSYVGRWNFEKMEKIQADKQLLKTVPPQGSKEYIRFLWDLVGGPLNYSETLSQINRIGNIVFLSDNVDINLTDMSCRITSKKFGYGIPQSVFYLDDDKTFIEKHLTQATLPFSVIIWKNEDRYEGMVVDRRLAKSLLFRLYFFEGKGLKYFEPFTTEEDLTKRTVICVYKINWEKFGKDFPSLPP